MFLRWGVIDLSSGVINFPSTQQNAFLLIWPMAHNVWLIESITSQVWQNISTQNNLCSNSISRHSWVILKPEQIHSMPELVGQKRQKISLEESFMIIYKKYCGWKFALATIPVLNFEVEQFDEGGEDAFFVEKDHVLLDVFQTLRIRLALKPAACNNTQQYRTLIRILAIWRSSVTMMISD